MTDPKFTPPVELVQQWFDTAVANENKSSEKSWTLRLANYAAQWGSDQELEACCEWIDDWYGIGSGEVIVNIRNARRPKSPSLKEQAFEALDRMDQFPTADDKHIIRQALEQLND
jgi:hypothetical protein